MPTPPPSTGPTPRRTRVWLGVLGVSSLAGLTAVVGGLVAGAPGCASTPSSSVPDATASTPAPAAPSGGALPDLTKEFETGVCEEIRGASVPGADSYFYGELSLSGDAVSGLETWWLNANKAWTDVGGTSCTIRWQLAGTKTTTSACRDCDFGVQVAGSPETGNSKCPEPLLKREARSQELRYDVKLSSNGEAFIYFAKSGKLLAQGFHRDGKVVYRTQHQCKWF